MSNFFSREYFLNLKFSLVGISWNQIFTCGYFMGQKILVGIVFVKKRTNKAISKLLCGKMS